MEIALLAGGIFLATVYVLESHKQQTEQAGVKKEEPLLRDIIASTMTMHNNGKPVDVTYETNEENFRMHDRRGKTISDRRKGQ